MSRWNDKGMTLFETIVSLNILIVCAALLLSFIPVFDKDVIRPDRDASMAAQQIKYDARTAYNIEAEGNILYMEEENAELSFEKTGTNLVRKRNGQGYEIVMQEVDVFQVTHQPYGADILIKRKNLKPFSFSVSLSPSFKKGGENYWIKKEP
ncbi:ComGF family competence protein [Alteribacillus sp. HJP-4]|uniref:ComGF family competence protein n=1 Tax=Alteribacillus sp. HJP-4 TaxID=2775394 RepID=UPI0035CD15C9